MKPFLVVFSANHARVVKDPAQIRVLRNKPHALLNPCLKAVKGLPPHLWQLQDDRIVPLPVAEIAPRIAAIALQAPKTHKPRLPPSPLFFYALYALLAYSCFITYWYFK